MRMLARVQGAVAFDFCSGIGAACARRALSRASSAAVRAPAAANSPACRCTRAMPGCSTSRASLPASSSRSNPLAPGLAKPTTTRVWLRFGSRLTRMGVSCAAALLGLQQFSPQGRLRQRVDGFVLPAGFFEQDDGAVGTGERVVRQRQRLRRDVDFQLGRNDFLHGENLDPDRLEPDHSRHAFCVQRAGRIARSGAGRMLTGRAGQSITTARRRQVPPGVGRSPQDVRNVQDR